MCEKLPADNACAEHNGTFDMPLSYVLDLGKEICNVNRRLCTFSKDYHYIILFSFADVFLVV